MKLREGAGVNIVDANCVGRHEIRIKFDDGHVDNVDFGPFLCLSRQPVVRKYLDAAKFKKFTIRDGNLVWGDYDMCFPIEDLYEGDIVGDRELRALHAVAESQAGYGKKCRSHGSHGK